jgi:hypothetical protein
MKRIVFVIAFVLFSLLAIGQKANYSGEWKLNEAKSELGNEFSLAPARITMKHTRKTLDMQIVTIWDGQEIVNDQHYTLNGKEVENIGFAESVTKSTAEVDKKSKAIKIVTKGSAEGMEYTLTQVISLKDGNLIMNSEAVSGMGELIETYIYSKL